MWKPLNRNGLTVLTALLLVCLTASIAFGAVVAQLQVRQLIPGLAEKVMQLPEPRLAQLRATKARADMEVLRQNYFVRNNVPFIRGAEGEEFELIPLSKMEYAPSAVQLQKSHVLATPLSDLRAYILTEPLVVATPPDVVDHRPDQTSVKNQSNRGTCVCFASMAGLEVAYGGGSLDLSEQYANYLYMKAEGHGCKSAGLQTHMSADYLSAHGVSQEGVCPYQNDKYNFPGYCNNGGLPAPAMRVSSEASSPYRIKSYQKIWRNDSLTTDTGLWINNPRYLEALLRGGKDIVFGTHVAGWVTPYTGVLDVKLGSSGDPLGSVGGHAMLIVGYNKPGEYFIVKNSWGTNKGQAGYLYLSYDYIRTYAKYGYVINEVHPLVLTIRRPMLRAVPRIQRSE